MKCPRTCFAVSKGGALLYGCSHGRRTNLQWWKGRGTALLWRWDAHLTLPPGISILVVGEEMQLYGKELKWVFLGQGGEGSSPSLSYLSFDRLRLGSYDNRTHGGCHMTVRRSLASLPPEEREWSLTCKYCLCEASSKQEGAVSTSVGAYDAWGVQHLSGGTRGGGAHGSVRSKLWHPTLEFRSRSHSGIF